jgi:hypothetical protein
MEVVIFLSHDIFPKNWLMRELTLKMPRGVASSYLFSSLAPQSVCTFSRSCGQFCDVGLLAQKPIALGFRNDDVPKAGKPY